MGLYESGVRTIVDNYLLEESKKVRDYGEYWSASSAGYCMRKLVFERLGVPKNNEDARRQRVFSSGHLFHDWIQGLTKAAGVSIAQELELQDEELMIRGHFDDLILVDGMTHYDDEEQGGVSKQEKHLILYDYKTVNSRSFLWAKKNGNEMSYFHKMQLGTYMYMLRKNWMHGTVGDGLFEVKDQLKDLSEARILKIEKDTLMMGEQKLMWTPELEKEVVEFWTTLNEYWKSKKMPPCTCEEREGGFMAKEAYNGYVLNGKPCSLEYYNLWKEGKLEVLQASTV